MCHLTPKLPSSLVLCHSCQMVQPLLGSWPQKGCDRLVIPCFATEAALNRAQGCANELAMNRGGSCYLAFKRKKSKSSANC